jgi:hypothetical protein
MSHIIQTNSDVRMVAVVLLLVVFDDDGTVAAIPSVEYFCIQCIGNITSIHHTSQYKKKTKYTHSVSYGFVDENKCDATTSVSSYDTTSYVTVKIRILTF